MEYPGSHFTRPYRLAFLGLFVLAFLILTPLVLLYSAGYRLDWQNGFLREAGGLSVDEITPKTVRVFLNDVALPDTLPIRLKNITPRDYDLRLAAPGFYDWNKRLTVKNKATIYLKQLSLIKKDTPRILAKGAAQALALSANGQWLIYTQTNDHGQTVWLRDLFTATTEPLATTTKNTRLNASWASQYPAVALTLDQLSESRLMVFDLARPGAPVFLNKLVAEPIKKFEWTDDPEPELYLGTDRAIYFFVLKTGSLVRVTPNAFDDWSVNGKQLWTLKSDTSTLPQIILAKDALGFSSRLKLPSDARDGEALITTRWRLREAYHNTGVLGTAKNNSLLIAHNNVFLPVPGDTARHSTLADWWVFWNSAEVWAYRPGANPELLNRSGEQLRKVVILDKFNTIALVWSDQITILFPSYLVKRDWLTGQFTDAVADPIKRRLYLSGTINKVTGLWQVDY